MAGERAPTPRSPRPDPGRGFGWARGAAATKPGGGVGRVAAVGDDELGEWQLAKLTADGMDTTGVTRVAGAHTGVALITVDAGGENQIAVASGANDRLDAPPGGRAPAAGEAAPRAARPA